MIRRAPKTKSPASALDAKTSTVNWNVNAVPVPRFNNTLAHDNRPYNVIQTSNQGVVLTSDAALPKFFTKNFSTSDIIQFANFAQVFDQYKINRIECWLVPYGPATVIGYNNSTKIYSVVDYDDSNTPASNTALQEYQNCVTTRTCDGHYISFKPHIAVAAYGGAFTQFKNEPSGWIDCASGAVQHYGVKLGIDNTTANGDCKIDMFTRVHVSFRNVF